MRTLLVCGHDCDSDRLKSWIDGADIHKAIGFPAESDLLANLSNVARPTLIVRVDGDHLQIARWTSMGQQVCPECLHLRTLSLRHPQELTAYLKGLIIGSHSCPWLTEFAHEVVSCLTSSLEASMTEFGAGYDIHLPTLRVRRFRVEPHSGCSLCASPIDDTSSEAVVRMRSCRKRRPDIYRGADARDVEIPIAACLDSTSGIFGPALTENRYHSFCAQVTGSFRECSGRSRPMFWSGRTTTYGRSLAVGLLEAYERHAGTMMRAKRCTVFDCYRNLTDCALDPRQCGLYEPTLYQSRGDLEPFSEETKLGWVWGYSLTEHRPLLVPLQCVYYGTKFEDEPRFVYENSNGCAAGISMEEAAFFAILELIERDAFLIHWHARLSPPQIDLATLKDAEACFLVERLRRQNLEVFLLDTRLDVTVPTITAVAVRRDNELGAFALASACSFDPNRAMASALAEVASRQVGFRERTESSKVRLYSALRDFSRVVTMEDHAALYGLPAAVEHARFLVDSVVRKSADEAYAEWLAAIPKTDDLVNDLTHCVHLLTSAGMNQIIVVDQTTPEQRRAGSHTVRVLVPGLMPMDFGNSQCRARSLGRLYSVPVRLGLRQEVSLDQLNRAPHPFA